MNTFDFFMENFGKYLVQDEGSSHKLSSQVLNSAHQGVGDKKALKIGAGWAVVQPGKALLQKELTAKGLFYFPDKTRYEVFGEILNNWSGTPTIFITFERTSFSVANLFITVDLRAVRICEPKGVQSFDYTREPTDSSPQFHRTLHKQRMKNAS